VKVYAGNSASVVLASLSGTSAPSPISVPSGGMYIRFTSDGSVERSGFTAQYSGVSASTFSRSVPSPSGETAASLNFAAAEDDKKSEAIEKADKSMPTVLIAVAGVVLVALIASIVSILFVKYRNRADLVSRAVTVTDSQIVPTAVSLAGTAQHPFAKSSSPHMSRKLAWMEDAAAGAMSHECTSCVASGFDECLCGGGTQNSARALMYTDFNEITARDAGTSSSSSSSNRSSAAILPSIQSKQSAALERLAQEEELKKMKDASKRIDSLMTSMDTHLRRTASGETGPCLLPAQVFDLTDSID